MIRTGFLLIFMLLAQATRAQFDLSEKMALYSRTIPTTRLFAHFDKNVYSNNEIAWFTAYQFNVRPTDTQEGLLSIVMVRNADSVVVGEDRFLLKNGLGFGSFRVPDKIPAGDYHFVLYTNSMIGSMPETTFIQDITLSAGQKPLNVSLRRIEDAQSGDAQVVLSTRTGDNKFLKKPAFIRYAYSDWSRNTITDGVGQLLMEIPLSAQSTDPRIKIRTISEKDTAFVSLELRPRTIPAQVNFYPEGGNLILGLPVKTGIEVRDAYGNPLTVTGYLYRDKKVIDTIQTGIMGMANFTLSAAQGSKYTFSINSKSLTDSTYVLPMAIAGVGVSVSTAIAQDTLRLIFTSAIAQKITMRLHNFKQIYAEADLDVVKALAVKIPLDGIPAGLAALTIFNESGKPISERMCMLKYDRNKKLEITTNDIQFRKRQEVELTLRLPDSVQGIVSISAAQENRYNLKKTKDIQSYLFLESEIGSLPAVNGNILEQNEHLENVLLIKGWRKYNWQDLEKVQPIDTLPPPKPLNFWGKVLDWNKPLNDSISLSLMNDSIFNFVTTDKKGHFQLEPSQLLSQMGKKLYAFVNSKTPARYDVQIMDEFPALNRRLAKVFPYTTYLAATYLNDSTEPLIPASETVLKIKEVEIRSNKDLTHYGTLGPNKCGDYVCLYNIFNCRNHTGFEPGSKQPVVGRVYLIAGRSGKMVYMGCVEMERENSRRFTGITIPKAFYLGNFKDPAEPALLSTIYWNHALPIPAGKEVKVKFFTGDIPGNFKINVQGITSIGVVSAQSTITVLP